MMRLLARLAEMDMDVYKNKNLFLEDIMAISLCVALFVLGPSRYLPHGSMINAFEVSYSLYTAEFPGKVPAF